MYVTYFSHPGLFDDDNKIEEDKKIDLDKSNFSLELHAKSKMSE